MNEWEQYLLELSAADRALLMAVRKKLCADNSPELRRVLLSALALPGAAGRKASAGRKIALKGQGRLLVFPARGVASGSDKTCNNSMLAEIGEPPGL